VLAVVLAALALALGCSSMTRQDLPWGSKSATFFDKEDNTPIVDLNYEAAEKMIPALKKTLPPGSPVYLEAFTDMDDATVLRPFGRVVANQVAARLSQAGFRITAANPADPDRPTPSKPGEFDPTPRDSSILGDVTPREAVLRGTYLLGKNVIYVSAQVMRLDDKAVVAGYDWTLPNNRNTRELLPQLKTPGLTPAVKTQPDPIISSPIVTPLPGEKPLNGKK
jgi:hypothetical protein